MMVVGNLFSCSCVFCYWDHVMQTCGSFAISSASLIKLCTYQASCANSEVMYAVWLYVTRCIIVIWMVDYEDQVSRRFVELRKTPLKFLIFKCIILRNYSMDCFENLTTSHTVSVYRGNY